MTFCPAGLISLFSINSFLIGMIDINNKRCLQENCYTIPKNNKYKGYYQGNLCCDGKNAFIAGEL